MAAAGSSGTTTTTKAKGPDMELKKAFAELQSKMVETKQKLRIADAQIENLRRQMTHTSLTEKELSRMDESQVRMFDSVGRMFVLSEKSQICDQLAVKQSGCAEKIKSLESNKEYLERSLKDSENSLRELIAQKMTSVAAGAP